MTRCTCCRQLVFRMTKDLQSKRRLGLTATSGEDGREGDVLPYQPKRWRRAVEAGH